MLKVAATHSLFNSGLYFEYVKQFDFSLHVCLCLQRKQNILCTNFSIEKKIQLFIPMDAEQLNLPWKPTLLPPDFDLESKQN
jgi:hypothetical protein